MLHFGRLGLQAIGYLPVARGGGRIAEVPDDRQRHVRRQGFAHRPVDGYQDRPVEARPPVLAVETPLRVGQPGGGSGGDDPAGVRVHLGGERGRERELLTLEARGAFCRDR